MAEAATATMAGEILRDDKRQDEEEEEEEGEIDDVEAGKVAASIEQRQEMSSQTRGQPHSQPRQAQQQKQSSKRPLLDSGVYIPPAKRRQLEQERQKAQEEQEAATNTAGQATDSAANAAVQRQTWQEQRRVIHGSINRLNAGTIKPLIQDLFSKVNLIRFRGVLCKSIMQAAISSPKYADVYAALISVVNSKLPEVGELCVKRSILAFRRHYKRREKSSCQAVCIFLAHLFHQAVVHELIILQLLSVLLDGDPTDDSVEVAIQLLQTTGQALLEVSPAGVRACLERLRALLHEGQLNARVEYKMEQLLKQRKTQFRDQPPPIPDELDLVERDDQITFEISLDDDEIQKEENLDVFSFNPDYEENEKEWAAMRNEILGGDGDSDTDSDDDSSSGSDDSDDSDDDEQQENEDIPDQELPVVQANSKATTVIQDLTEEDLIHLRRTIYLTIMSSATFEECTHKLNKIDIPEGREHELINMLIECCSQERTFLRYYGLIAARFCLIDNRWRDAFMESFIEQYKTIHRLETNKLRNVAKLFAHLLHTDSIPWVVLSTIHLNEDETTSSSRIFIKIVIQEMAEAIGIAKLKQRFEVKKEEDPEAAAWYEGMFPKDNVRNTRYAINFFTSIGLGPLTDDLREFLKNAPKLILQRAKEQQAALAKQREEDDDSSSVSSTSSSSSSSSSSVSSTSSSSSGSSSGSSSSGSYSSYSSRRRGRSRRRNGRRRRSRSYSSSSRSADSRSSSGSRRSKDSRHRRRHVSRSTSETRVKDDGGKRKDATSQDDPSSTKEKRDRKRRRSPQSRSRSPTKQNDRNGNARKSKGDSPPTDSRASRKRRSSRSRSRSGSRSDENQKNRNRSLSASPKGRRRRSRSSSSSSDGRDSRRRREDDRDRGSHSKRRDRSHDDRRKSKGHERRDSRSRSRSGDRSD